MTAVKAMRHTVTAARMKAGDNSLGPAGSSGPHRRRAATRPAGQGDRE